MGLDMTQLAPSVDAGVLLVAIGCDDETNHAASLQVCAHAVDVEDATRLMTMLGLMRPYQACGHPLDDVVRVKVTATRYVDRCLTCKPRGKR